MALNLFFWCFRKNFSYFLSFRIFLSHFYYFSNLMFEKFTKLSCNRPLEFFKFEAYIFEFHSNAIPFCLSTLYWDWQTKKNCRIAILRKLEFFEIFALQLLSFSFECHSNEHKCFIMHARKLSKTRLFSVPRYWWLIQKFLKPLHVPPRISTIISFLAIKLLYEKMWRLGR